jgi:hypothetical protein
MQQHEAAARAQGAPAHKTDAPAASTPSHPNPRAHEPSGCSMTQCLNTRTLPRSHTLSRTHTLSLCQGLAPHVVVVPAHTVKVQAQYGTCNMSASGQQSLLQGTATTTPFATMLSDPAQCCHLLGNNTKGASNQGTKTRGTKSSQVTCPLPPPCQPQIQDSDESIARQACLSLCKTVTATSSQVQVARDQSNATIRATTSS